MFLNMEHSMAENEENSFLTCNLVFVSFSFDKRGEMKNHSVEIDFLLLGLTDDPQLQIVIFLFLFFNYILSVRGNLIIILLTFLDLCLRTPMYLFLQNFSFLEISFTTACIPKFLISLLTGDKTISYSGCVTQLLFFLLLGATEFYLLAAISYDCYAAICKPLYYPIIMNRKVCHQFVLSSWITGFLIIFPPLVLELKLGFYASKIIDQFLCDTSPILQLSYTDTHIPELMAFVLVVVTLVVTLLLVVLSYTYIVKNHSKIAFCSTTNKSLFHLLLTHGCWVYHLWELYFYIYEIIS